MPITIRELFDRVSLKYHDELNPKLWVDDKLKPEITQRLLEIAEAWREFSKIPQESIEDIILTGGNVNFNYTELSDLDLHLVCDMTKMPVRNEEIMTDIIFSKKALWKNKHPDIRIYGYEVELFAQDVHKAFPVHQGVYSVLHDQWLVKPEHLGLSFHDDFALADKADSYHRQIKDLLAKGDTDGLRAMKEKIHGGRAAAIAAGGEFAFDNLVFKELRNRGVFKQIDDHLAQTYDRALSLEHRIRN